MIKLTKKISSVPPETIGRIIQFKSFAASVLVALSSLVSIPHLSKPIQFPEAMVLVSKLLMVGVTLTVASAVFGFWGFWRFVSWKIKGSATLATDTDLRKAWEKTPIAVDFNVYVFNVTNPLEVQGGAKPSVEEIGPFAFFEWKEKVNIVDYEVNDTVSFNMKNTWYFNPDGSGGLTMDETVVVPHIAMLSLAYMVEKKRPGSLSIVEKAIPALYNSSETVFLTTTVRDLLFDGNVINCTVVDFASAAICTALRAKSSSLHKVSEDIFKFSLFGVKNGTPDTAPFNVLRGTAHHEDVGRVKLYNHEPELHVWGGAECNRISGTDSTVFSALMDPKDDLVSFSPDLCRSIAAKHQFHTDYKGFSVGFYNASLGDASSNSDEKCFCPTPSSCPKKGALDLTNCQESPIVVTLPHFYDADPSFLEAVNGLRPDSKKHQIVIFFEPITGTPLSARKRLQFNIYLHPVTKIKRMKSLPNAMTPIFWVEEGVDLSAIYLTMLDDNLFAPLRIVAIVRWFGIVVGLLIIIASVYYRYRLKKSVKVEDFVEQPEAVNDNTSSPNSDPSHLMGVYRNQRNQVTITDQGVEFGTRKY